MWLIETFENLEFSVKNTYLQTSKRKIQEMKTRIEDVLRE